MRTGRPRCRDRRWCGSAAPRVCPSHSPHSTRRPCSDSPAGSGLRVDKPRCWPSKLQVRNPACVASWVSVALAEPASHLCSRGELSHQWTDPEPPDSSPCAPAKGSKPRLCKMKYGLTVIKSIVQRTGLVLAVRPDNKHVTTSTRDQQPRAIAPGARRALIVE